MKEEYVDIPCSVELKNVLEKAREQEIARLEEQLEALKEDSFDAILKRLIEEHDATYV